MRDPAEKRKIAQHLCRIKTSSAKQTGKAREVGERNRNQGDSYEAEIERRLRLRRQRGSGCGKIELEDLIGVLGGKDYMVQAKSFSKKSISIPIKALEKLIKHARETDIWIRKRVFGCPCVKIKRGRRPAFIVGIRTKEPFDCPRDWVMVPLEDWKP